MGGSICESEGGLSQLTVLTSHVLRSMPRQMSPRCIMFITPVMKPNNMGLWHPVHQCMPVALLFFLIITLDKIIRIITLLCQSQRLNQDKHNLIN